MIRDTAPTIVSEPGPFLKWAGGKQQLLAQLEPLFPAAIRDYYEPFVGSAAVFFHLRRHGRLRGDVHLSDNNADLVNAYVMVRDRVEEVVELLAVHERLHSREHYYRVRHQDRAEEPLSPVEAASRLIYLNRTCYNGLYRVNRRGEFNVPMGSYLNPKILFAEGLRAASAALQDVELWGQGFEEIVGMAGPRRFRLLRSALRPGEQDRQFHRLHGGKFRRRRSAPAGRRCLPA